MCLVFMSIGKKLSWLTSSTWLFLTFYSVFWTLLQEWKVGPWGTQLFPCPSILSVVIILWWWKWIKSNPFVSLIYLLIPNYSISELSRMRINFHCAFPQTGERMSSCMKFWKSFSKSRHYCFSALCQHLSLWRKERMSENRTEYHTGRTLGCGVFTRDRKSCL